MNDISENIFNLSNEIATNVMNVFSDLSNSLNQDNSNNILTNELIFNIPNIFNNIQPNNSTFPETNYKTHIVIQLIILILLIQQNKPF